MRHSLAAAGSPGALRVLTREGSHSLPTSRNSPTTYPPTGYYPAPHCEARKVNGFGSILECPKCYVCVPTCPLPNHTIVQDFEVKLFGTFSREDTPLSKKHLNRKGKHKRTDSTPDNSPTGLTPQGQILPQPRNIGRHICQIMDITFVALVRTHPAYPGPGVQ